MDHGAWAFLLPPTQLALGTSSSRVLPIAVVTVIITVIIVMLIITTAVDCTSRALWLAFTLLFSHSQTGGCSDTKTCLHGMLEYQNSFRVGCHLVQDTKSLDGKTSLLSYIARQLSTGHSPAALLAHEMPHVVGPALKTSVQVPFPRPVHCLVEH